MLVSAWKNGTYGTRLSGMDVTTHFKSHWLWVQIKIGRRHELFNLAPTFWTTCPEIRVVAIANWLVRGGHVPWPTGQPPQFDLVCLDARTFELL